MRPSRWLRLTLCAGLLALSWPAGAVDKIVEIGRLPAPQAALGAPAGLEPVAISPNALSAVPVLPVSTELSVPQAGVLDAPAGPAQMPLAAPSIANGAAQPELQTLQPEAPQPDVAAACAEAGRRFDGSFVKKAAVPAVVAGAGAAVYAARHSWHALAPYANTASYDAANLLSVAFPLPEAYAALRRGNAEEFPLKRALIGAAGTLALGMVNATVLGKPLWGAMHTFIALGMIAPYVIGKILEKRGGAPLSRAAAIKATVAVGAAMLALSAGLYAGAAALIPAFLAAHLSAAAVAQLLLWIQIAKGALFIGAFAPDVAALLRGQPAKGFSKAFTAIYLASVAAFTLWGFSAAAASPAGPIREQYLVHGLRNLAETVASGLSLAALMRSGNGPKKIGPKSGGTVPVGPKAPERASSIMKGSRNTLKEVAS